MKELWRAFGRLERGLALASVALLVGQLGYLGSQGGQFSRLVPTHFDLEGYPDAWGVAASVWSQPGLTLVLLVVAGGLCVALTRVAAAAPGAALAWGRVRAAVLLLAFTGSLLLTWITVGAVVVGRGQAKGLGPLYGPGSALLLAVSCALVAITFLKARKMKENA